MTVKKTVINLVSEVDSKIKQFEDNFIKFKAEFQVQGGLHTEIITLHVLDKVEGLGMFPFFVVAPLLMIL